MFHIRQHFGKVRPWYCLTHFIESGHSSEQVISAPVYVGPAIAKELGMKAEPWEHIVLIGIAHNCTIYKLKSNGKALTDFAAIAAVKYVWDTRKITEVKYFDDYKVYELYKHMTYGHAKDNHEPIEGIDKVYDKLDEMYNKQIADRNKK
jgi:hypothetical protein